MDVRQRMKLTGTNRSIDLILSSLMPVRPKVEQAALLCPHGQRPPDGARHAPRRPVSLAGFAHWSQGQSAKRETQREQETAAGPTPLLPYSPTPSLPASLDAFRRPGGHGGAPPPDPIPNSAVKRSSAHDTSSQDAGKSVAARSAKRINPSQQQNTPRGAEQRPSRLEKTGGKTKNRAAQPPFKQKYRGVEQPGSSSGS